MSIEELEKQIKALQEEIEKLKVVEKKQKSKKWKPEEGEEYYFITDCGRIGSHYFGDFDSVDNWRYKNIGIFQTKKEAEQYKKFRDDVLAHSYEFSDEEWENTDIKKYYIYSDCNNNSFSVGNDWNFKDFNKIYFKTYEDAQYIIDNYSEELKKWRI